MPAKGLALGFTLLELLIVMAVGVIGMAAMAARLSTGNPSTELRAAARDVASALRYARSQALIGHQTISVDIDLANNSYRISNRDKVYPLKPEIDISLEIAEDEFADGEVGSIRFFSDGSSTGGRILLECEQRLRRVDVNWITGEVAISESKA